MTAPTPDPSIQIELTEEQQALILQLTGEHATVLELAPEPGDPAAGSGRGLRFKWRLSIASGIPRLAWGNQPTKEIPIPTPDSAS